MSWNATRRFAEKRGRPLFQLWPYHHQRDWLGAVEQVQG